MRFKSRPIIFEKMVKIGPIVSEKSRAQNLWKKIIIKNSYPIFVPRRAPRNSATGAKQHNSAQLQTIDYLS